MIPHPYFVIELSGEPFYLLSQKAVFRPKKNQLIVSDIHLGKATHFRKMGIPMPEQSHLKDIDTLQFLLRKFQPSKVILLGDLFHSEYNREWLWFGSLLTEFHDVEFILIQGNHDVLPPAAYAIPNLTKQEFIVERNFIFSHHPLEDQKKLNICGHLHPGIMVNGYAKQRMKFPCFYLSKKHFILPAFGNLTGLYLLEREASAEYFLVAEGRVIPL